MKRIVVLLLIAFILDSCVYGGYKAEEEIVKLQEKLDKIHCLAEEFVIDEDIDSIEQERIQEFIWAIEEESTYEEFDFYVPE